MLEVPNIKRCKEDHDAFMLFMELTDIIIHIIIFLQAIPNQENITHENLVDLIR